MNIGEKLDHIITRQDQVTEDVTNIKNKLLGNEYNIGMIDDFEKLKKTIYKLIEQVKKIWIIGSVLAVILTFLVSAAHYIKDFFT